MSRRRHSIRHRNPVRCFQPRLTPKTWRIGLARPPARRPFKDAEAAFNEWHQRYTAICANHATCSLLGALGPEAIHPFIAPIVELHDEMTRVETALALA